MASNLSVVEPGAQQNSSIHNAHRKPVWTRFCKPFSLTNSLDTLPLLLVLVHVHKSWCLTLYSIVEAEQNPRGFLLLYPFLLGWAGGLRNKDTLNRLYILASLGITVRMYRCEIIQAAKEPPRVVACRHNQGPLRLVAEGWLDSRSSRRHLACVSGLLACIRSQHCMCCCFGT
jgi:hypothetical protein